MRRRHHHHHRLIAPALAALAVLGGACAPDDTGRRPPEKPGEKPAEPPKTPVSQCEVAHDVALGEGEATSPAIAYDGGRFAVAWTDLTRGAGDIVLTLVDERGEKHGEQRLAGTAAAEITPAIATLPGGGWLVAWEELGAGGGSVRAVRVDPSGKPAGAPLTLATGVSPEAHPAVAATKKGGLVAWTEAASAVVAEVERDTVGEKLPIAGAVQLAVTGAGDGAAAVWSAGQRLGFMRLGAPLSGGARQSKEATLFRDAAGRANLPRVAAGPNGDFATVWEDARGGPENESVLFAHIGEDGRADRELTVSPGGGSANFPDVTWLGERAAIAYYQYRDGPSSVYLALVDPRTGVAGKELRVSGNKKGARFPRIAWGGAGTLGVTYAERTGPTHLAIVTCE